MGWISRRGFLFVTASFFCRAEFANAQELATLRGSNIRLREHPDFGSKSLAVLQGGMQVTLTGKDDLSSGWRFIEAITQGNTIGWIRWEFIVGAQPGTDPSSQSADSPAPTFAPAPNLDGNESGSSGSPTSDELDYITEITPIVQELGSSAIEFDRLLKGPKLNDEQWASSVAPIYETWSRLEEDFNAIAPPPSFKRFYNQMSIALGLFDEAQRLIRLGTDNDDQEQLKVGVEKLVQATIAGDRAMNMLERLTSKYTN